MTHWGLGDPYNRQPARLLLIVPLIFLIIFGCGQLAIGDAVYPAAPDTRSKLHADYSAWPFVLMPAINPAILREIQHDEHLDPIVIVVRPFWPTPDRLTAPPQPTSIAQQPTSTSVPPTGTPTFIDTHTPTLLPTRTPTPYPTRTARPTATSTARPTATQTMWPTATARLPQTNTRTHTPTPIMPSATASPTATSTPTLTPSLPASDTPTATPTSTATPSQTPTLTSTPTGTTTATSTATPTSTATSTSTPTPTSTPNNPCPGNIPSSEPNIGPPNGIFTEIQCGSYIDIDLGSQVITSTAGFDFVYYERTACSGICLDWVQVDVCETLPCPARLTVFNWGDGLPDNNTNVASFAAGGELDNQDIPAAALHCANGYCTGITIDVDAFGTVPPSGYRYIRIWSPYNWPANDGSEVDSIEIVP